MTNQPEVEEHIKERPRLENNASMDMDTHAQTPNRLRTSRDNCTAITST